MSLPDPISKKIIRCERCPRLRNYCSKIAKTKRKAYLDFEYWGKPVPSFGDLSSRVLIVGLAPGAHGANRTGRMFTGDQSGLWLYRALARAGFANQIGFKQAPDQAHREDGLKLTDVRITSVAHCAPPANRPTLKEVENCSEFLKEELATMKRLRVFLVLGQIGLQGLWKGMPEEWKPGRAMPRFSHGARFPLKNGMWILCSYHPSQQNTFTHRLTEAMFDRIFDELKQMLLNV